MINLINWILKRFNIDESKIYIELARNDKCFCNSGKKFKHCHLPHLDKKGKIALFEIDKHTGEKRTIIYSKRKYKGLVTRSKSNLRGVDVKATDIALNS